MYHLYCKFYTVKIFMNEDLYLIVFSYANFLMDFILKCHTIRLLIAKKCHTILLLIAIFSQWLWKFIVGRSKTIERQLIISGDFFGCKIEKQKDRKLNVHPTLSTAELHAFVRGQWIFLIYLFSLARPQLNISSRNDHHHIFNETSPNAAIYWYYRTTFFVKLEYHWSSIWEDRYHMRIEVSPDASIY